MGFDKDLRDFGVKKTIHRIVFYAETLSGSNPHSQKTKGLFSHLMSN